MKSRRLISPWMYLLYASTASGGTCGFFDSMFGAPCSRFRSAARTRGALGKRAENTTNDIRPPRRFPRLCLHQLAAPQPAVQLERVADDGDGLVCSEHVLDHHLLVLERLVVLEEALQLAHQMRGQL